MIALIITGIICLVGLVSLIRSIIRAPFVDIDENGFRHEDRSTKLLR
jgi:hypothetical protein